MWTANLSSGEVRLNGILAGSFYSGKGEGRNNPAFEKVPNVGPIPRGKWKISGPPFNHPKHGLYCLRLEPLPGTETFGRDGFLWHGDSLDHPGEASEGCMVSSPVTRARVYQSGDDLLVVISGEIAPDLDREISV